MTHILNPVDVQTGFKPKRTLVFYVLIETFSCPTATEASQSCTVDAGGALQFPLLFWVFFFVVFFSSRVEEAAFPFKNTMLCLTSFISFFYVVVTLRKNTQMKSSAH